MGILNITPDSFYDGGRYEDPSKVVARAGKMLAEGARFIDLGASSTRPGAEEIGLDQELERLARVFPALRDEFPDALFSVDTYRAEVARVAVRDWGACMVNDISAGQMDPAMFAAVAELGVPYVLTHLRGTPRTMQQAPQYDNLMKDIFRFMAEKVDQLNLLGVNDIILDPGFGFGKTLDHNYEMMQKLGAFKIFELPLLVGISRKSMIHKYLGTSAEEALAGTISLNTLALRAGANLLRVHDVREASDVVKLHMKLRQTF